MSKSYQICKRCIMDTSDPEIEFDSNGICNHCHAYDIIVENELHYDAAGQKELERIIEKIKAEGEKKRYDCILGISGGVDSSYAAYKAKELGLRPLAVHFDNGWNSELAVNNIEQLLNKMGIVLYTYVVDWEEFKDLQVAFLKASTPDSEIPTDHAIIALLYKMAAKEGIRYIITGQNIVTEGYAPRAWSQGHGDWRYIRNIHKRFGRLKRLATFPHYGILSFLYYKLIKKIEIIKIMNFIPYVKKDAVEILTRDFNWKPYAEKHGESLYTLFFQTYILPTKFGFDKRRIHLSALIASGQLSRDEALREVEKELFEPAQLESEKTYVIKKLGLSEEEFEQIMNSAPKSFWDYPSYKRLPIFKNPTILSYYHRLKKT